MDTISRQQKLEEQVAELLKSRNDALDEINNLVEESISTHARAAAAEAKLYSILEYAQQVKMPRVTQACVDDVVKYDFRYYLEEPVQVMWSDLIKTLAQQVLAVPEENNSVSSN